MQNQLRQRSPIYATLLVSALLWLTFQDGYAQFISAWTPPQRIPGFGDTTLTPYLAADQNNTVHAFTSDWVGSQNSLLGILYAYWTPDRGWTTPTDILLPARGQARMKGLYLDPEGIMHLVFFGGDDLTAEIYYTRAPAAAADNAQAWTDPVAIGDKAITPDEATLAGDGQGGLFMIYSGDREGNGLYAVRSQDGGTTWSEPVAIYLTGSQTLWPLALQSYIDPGGIGHAVWSYVDESGNGQAVYYARQGEGDDPWSLPVELATRMSFEADTPSIIEYDGELMVIYHNDRPTTRWMRRSADGGRTWSEPVRLYPHVGSNGPASMVIDGSGTLHMFFGNRLGGRPDIHGLWHSLWTGARWSDPTAITSGPVRPDYDPSFARAIGVQGNTILVTWRQDPGSKQLNGAWFTSAQVNAPQLPLVPLPTADIQTTLTPDTQETPGAEAPALLPDPPSEFQDSVAAPEVDPNTALLIGSLPVVILITGVLIYYWVRRSSY